MHHYYNCATCTLLIYILNLASTSVGLFCIIGDKIKSIHSEKSYEVQEVGIMHPDETPVSVLYVQVLLIRIIITGCRCLP